MKITEIISQTKKPKLYEMGTSFMWTDEHISQQLLNVHLNPDVDLASRKKSTIEKTAAWILETQEEKRKLNILDLGCGPGLYTELFAEKGHYVTGVDISKNSIEYAKQAAEEKKLDITYLGASYLDIDLGTDKYDLVTLIFTDLGTLIPDDRDKLLKKIYRALKKGGTFIFDVLKDKDIEDKMSPNTWELGKSGFWKASPYLALSTSFLYPKEKVILYQHNILPEGGGIETYRFWTHFFSYQDVAEMLSN